MKVLLISAGLLGALFILTHPLPDPAGTYTKIEPPAIDALHAEVRAQEEISSRLVSPGSARFAPAITEERDKSTWSVTGQVDSQNRFGALLRTHYTCVMKVMPTGYWGDVNCSTR